MSKRFDRLILDDGKMDKLHMQTLGALMHIDYNSPGLISYEAVVQMMYKLGLKNAEGEQFYRRLVFNVMARNQDDHVKNISFLMNRSGVWSLAPAYDVTYAFNMLGKWTNAHQMLINGKINDIDISDLLQSAWAVNVKQKRALEIINDVKTSLLNFDQYAQQAHLEKELSNAIKATFLLFK